VDDAYTTTCRFTTADDDHDIATSHLGECTVNSSQLRVADGYYTPPPRRPWFRLDDSTSAILAVISIILALSLYGLYSQYRRRCARPQAIIEDEQVLPLMSPEGGVGDSSDVD